MACKSVGSNPCSRAVVARAVRSFPKQEPPQPSPAFRYNGEMRWSMPMAPATCVTSAPTRSQIWASSLMNEIFIAKNEFEAYLMSSAVPRLALTSAGASSL